MINRLLSVIRVISGVVKAIGIVENTNITVF